MRNRMQNPTITVQLLLGLASPAELTALFYCLIWDSTNLEGQVPIFRSHILADTIDSNNQCCLIILSKQWMSTKILIVGFPSNNN
jgi:hypothetical protein